MRDLEGAPFDVAAAAAGAALAFGVVGGVTAALTRRRPASSTRESDDDKVESSPRGRARAATGGTASSASIARAPFLVLLILALVLLAVEHAKRRAWGAPIDPLDVRGVISAIERLAPPPSRADVSPHCARVQAFPDLFDAHGHPDGFPADVHVGGMRLNLDDSARDPRLARAEQHFKQGLALCFGFNREEGRRHFLLAARLARDARHDCAPCLWGVAYALHPDINNWRTHTSQRAAGRLAAASASALASRDVVEAKIKHAGDETRVRLAEKVVALADAESAFFGVNAFDHSLGSTDEDLNDVLGDPNDERAQLDAHRRYLRALETSVESFANANGANDPDLLAFLGEACMNLTPWRYWNWTVPDGTSAGSISEAELETLGPVKVREREGARSEDAYSFLTRAFALDKRHPLAAHMLVHLTEALPIRNLRFSNATTAKVRDSSAKAREGAIDAVLPFSSQSEGVQPVAVSPRLGEPAADALFSSFASDPLRARLSPHLAHMAAHAYVRIGRLRSAVEASVAATRGDAEMVKKCVFPYGQAHNRAMLATAATAAYGISGFGIAMNASVDPGEMLRVSRGAGDSSKTAGRAESFLDRHANFLTAYHDVPATLTASRFGKWRTILKLAAETEREAMRAGRIPSGLVLLEKNATAWLDVVSTTPFGKAQWAYALGLASLRKFEDASVDEDSGASVGSDASDVSDDDSWIFSSSVSTIEPSQWLRSLRALASSPDMKDFDDLTVVPGISSRGGPGAFHEFSPFRHVKRRLALIAAHTLGGAWHMRSGEIPEAIASLDSASKVHATLPYMEPEHWYLPVRLCLGEAFLRAGNPLRASEIFSSEIRDSRPNDAWATQGDRRARKRLEAGVPFAETEDRETACFEVFP
jgi:hypothetical protein